MNNGLRYITAFTPKCGKWFRDFGKKLWLAIACLSISLASLSQTTTNTTLTSSPNPSCLNTAVTFTATVDAPAATGPVRFFDGPVEIGNTTLSGGVATLVISNLSAGSHSITAVYDGVAPYNGSTSPAITHIVNQPPAITSQPTGLTTGIGCNVSLNVGASGTNPLSYQWMLNGNPISGATSSTYSINPVAASHAGNYTVVVTNSCGSVTSNVATINVNSPLNPGAHNTDPVTGCDIRR